MKRYLSLVFVLFSRLALAQTPADPSKSSAALRSMDTLRQQIMLGNANLVTYSRFDSIRPKFNVSADSFHGQYRNMIADFNAETKRINQTIDSLETTTSH